MCRVAMLAEPFKKSCGLDEGSRCAHRATDVADHGKIGVADVQPGYGLSHRVNSAVSQQARRVTEWNRGDAVKRFLADLWLAGNAAIINAAAESLGFNRQAKRRAQVFKAGGLLNVGCQICHHGRVGMSSGEGIAGDRHDFRYGGVHHPARAEYRGPIYTLASQYAEQTIPGTEVIHGHPPTGGVSGFGMAIARA